MCPSGGNFVTAVPCISSPVRLCTRRNLQKGALLTQRVVLKEGELTLKLLNLFFDSVTKFQNMDTVLQPIFYELVSKTMHQLHVSKDKEGYLDLLLNLFRTIQVLILCWYDAPIQGCAWQPYCTARPECIDDDVT